MNGGSKLNHLSVRDGVDSSGINNPIGSMRLVCLPT